MNSSGSAPAALSVPLGLGLGMRSKTIGRIEWLKAFGMFTTALLLPGMALAQTGEVMTVGDKAYVLVQFHFHAPSEHTVNGEHFPMEMHYVHQAEDGALGVNWYVRKTPTPLSRDQIAAFMAVYGHNNRPVQALNNRALYLDENPDLSIH